MWTYLPADFGGQVFDDHPVLGPGGSSVLLDPLAPPPVAAPAVAAAGPAGVLHRHPRPVQVATVEVAHRVVRIAVVVKLLAAVRKISFDMGFLDRQMTVCSGKKSIEPPTTVDYRLELHYILTKNAVIA